MLQYLPNRWEKHVALTDVWNEEDRATHWRKKRSNYWRMIQGALKFSSNYSDPTHGAGRRRHEDKWVTEGQSQPESIVVNLEAFSPGMFSMHIRCCSCPRTLPFLVNPCIFVTSRVTALAGHGFNSCNNSRLYVRIRSISIVKIRPHREADAFLRTREPPPAAKKASKR